MPKDFATIDFTSKRLRTVNVTQVASGEFFVLETEANSLFEGEPDLFIKLPRSARTMGELLEKTTHVAECGEKKFQADPTSAKGIAEGRVGFNITRAQTRIISIDERLVKVKPFINVNLEG